MDGKKISTLKGIGPKTEQSFQKLGIYTVQDLLRYYPRDYDIYEPPVPIATAPDDAISAVAGIVTRQVYVRKVRQLQIVTTVIGDDTGTLNVTWFNTPYVRNMLHSGQQVILRGKITKKGNNRTMEQPEIFAGDAYEKQLDTMQPIYPLTTGVNNKMIVRAVTQALEDITILKEFIPESIRQQYHLAEYNFSLPMIHFPENKEMFMEARKRLVFEEFFIFILALRRMREKKEISWNDFRITSSEQAEQLKDNLEFTLTNAQEKVWGEIKKDLMGAKVMSRLVQGDVGSGKTILAVLAMIMCAENGYQSALMAPTEVLAKQHYLSITKLLEEHHLPYKVQLLTGSMTVKEKRRAYDRILIGNAQIIIGTHALIQDAVAYDKLALVITDEQHRFGVKQREAFSQKGSDPHVLVMSATPIPRTLAIIVYGDLDISVVDELPAERVPIKNCVVGTDYRPKAYQFIISEVKKGRQAYIICPMVDESENLDVENVVAYTENLRTQLPESIHVEYLHGKMKQYQKDDIMERYSAGEIQVLVATTVIEVGVNVPNASVMMVENAERFGLAQLHQLRGRVGRGRHQSYCIFISGQESETTMRRLKILNESNDGFYIANEDLKLRGPGDLFGIRQSGMLEFKIGDIFTDAKILQNASEAVNQLLDEDPELEKEEHQNLKKYLNAYIGEAFDKVHL